MFRQSGDFLAAVHYHCPLVKTKPASKEIGREQQAWGLSPWARNKQVSVTYVGLFTETMIIFDCRLWKVKKNMYFPNGFLVALDVILRKYNEIHYTAKNYIVLYFE